MAAAAAIGALPKPDSLEKIPFDTPCCKAMIKVLPKNPPIAACPLKAASMMDSVGNKVAKNEIAMIKVAAPNMALKIIDDAIQAFGGAGVTSDPKLAQAYAGMRTLRLADGPDEVHKQSIARSELKKYL